MHVLVIASFVMSALCPAASAPVNGPIVGQFEPIGRYAGHWGVDYAAPAGSEVRAVASGLVTFAGSVAGRNSVSIDHGRGFMTTLSYLRETGIGTGTVLGRGDPVGRSGLAHGRDAVHLSLRIDGVYVDPSLLFRCQVGEIPDALALVATDL